MDLQKLLKIIAAVVGVVSIIFLVTIISAGDDAIKAGESATSVSTYMYVAYFILAIAVLAVVFFTVLNPTIGSLGNPKHFYWPTTPEQAKDIFYYWLEHDLPFFGDFQDAMARNQWAMYHSRISFALNTKMIDPLWVCQEVARTYIFRPSPLTSSCGAPLPLTTSG